jgi:hypothetical protein
MARIGRVRGGGPGLPDLVAVTVQGSPKGPSGAPTCAARSVGGAYRNGGDRRQTRQPSLFLTRVPLGMWVSRGTLAPRQENAYVLLSSLAIPIMPAQATYY